jgi:TRAP-type C4-dicarboxylate transport system substrate-binding protein
MLGQNNQEGKGKQLSRRDFLKASGVVLASTAFFNVLAACSSTSTATTTVPVRELVFASSNSTTHPQSIADQAWMDRIQQLTGGRIHFTPYWGGALMASADSFDELVAGVADVTEFSGAYVAADFDLEKAMRILFYGVSTPDIARQVYDEVRAQFPQIDQEFSKVIVLARHAVSPYQLITIDRPVRTLADFAGLRLKTTGEFAQIAGKIGAIGQTVPMADTYVALQKGTVDGAFTPAETLKSFNFADVIKYVTMLNMAVGPTPHRAMNMETWNSLPADIQQIFEDNIVWYGKEIEKDLFAADQAGLDLATQNGAEIINLSASELASFYTSVNEVCLENMAKLDTKGLPGTQMYNKIRELIAKYNT